MAFPSITPLRISEFDQRPTADVLRTADGHPLVLEMATSRKHGVTAEYLLSTSEWNSLITDFEENHSTSFSWTDARTSTSRTMRYAARPSRRQISGGARLTSANHHVFVQLVEA